MIHTSKLHPNSFTAPQAINLTCDREIQKQTASAKREQASTMLTAGCTQHYQGIQRRDAIHTLSIGQGSGWQKQPCCVGGISLHSETSSDADIAQGVYAAQNNLFCLTSQSYSIMVKTHMNTLKFFQGISTDRMNTEALFQQHFYGILDIGKVLSFQIKPFGGRHCLLPRGLCPAEVSTKVKQEHQNTLSFTFY